MLVQAANIHFVPPGEKESEFFPLSVSNEGVRTVVLNEGEKFSSVKKRKEVKSHGNNS